MDIFKKKDKIKSPVSKEQKMLKILSNSAIFLFFFYVIFKITDFFYQNGIIISWGQSFELINSIINPEFIIAFFTALYVLFTYLMFLSNKKQTEALEKQIEESKKPNLIVRFEPFGIMGVVLKIQNVGKGNAHDISVDYELRKDNKSILKEKWVHTILQPTEFVRLMLFDNKSYLDFLKEFDEFEFKTNCYGDDQLKVDSLPTILNLKKFLEYMQGDRWILETTTADDIHDISKEIKEIKKTLKSPSGNQSNKVDIKGILKSLQERNKKSKEKN
jgi:preprotein translocase subunit YajC